VCACGCFVLAAVAAALAYFVIHALWWAVVAIVVLCVVLGWFSRKFVAARKS
jgi:hypothetical protein